jgi:hypothetical protein
MNPPGLRAKRAMVYRPSPAKRSRHDHPTSGVHAARSVAPASWSAGAISRFSTVSPRPNVLPFAATRSLKKRQPHALSPVCRKEINPLMQGRKLLPWERQLMPTRCLNSGGIFFRKKQARVAISSRFPRTALRVSMVLLSPCSFVTNGPVPALTLQCVCLSRR